MINAETSIKEKRVMLNTAHKKIRILQIVFIRTRL